MSIDRAVWCCNVYNPASAATNFSIKPQLTISTFYKFCSLLLCACTELSNVCISALYPKRFCLAICSIRSAAIIFRGALLLNTSLGFQKQKYINGVLPSLSVILFSVSYSCNIYCEVCYI